MATVTAVMVWLLVQLVPVPPVNLPGQRFLRSGHLWFEWNRPRAIQVSVSPSRTFSAPGITYAEGVATADRMPPSTNYRVLLISWWLLAGVPLVVCALSYAGLARQRARHRRQEARAGGTVSPPRA